MRIFNVGNKAINLWLLDSGSHRLLIDSGFPGQLNELGRKMRETGFKIKDIDYLIVTHFHPDHAGAVQELKNEGVKFILVDLQQNFIQPMENMIKDKWKYTTLNLPDNIVLPNKDATNFLRQVNIPAEIISTPGHSDDSISVVLDSGETFTGDLLPEHLNMESTSQSMESWRKLKSKGAKKIYPSHGNIYEIKN